MDPRVPPSLQIDAARDEVTPARPRRHRRWVWLGGALAVLVVAAVVAAVVRVPYYTVSPGAMRVTEPHVTIEGAEVYRDDAGDIGYMTVTFSHATVLGMLWGTLHPDIDVLSEREALGGRDRDENREINVRLMAGAKEVSTAVALEALGYEVGLVGTGAHVIAIEENSPADSVLEVGDTVVAIDGEPVGLAEDMVEIVTAHEPGDELELVIERPREDDEDLDTEEVTIELAERDDAPESGFLGVRAMTRDAGFDTPFEVSIDSGDVIGPSAGLAFSLTLIDLLTPDSLTGDDRVAVTGTIDVEGNVGRIGGVEQKAVAARSAGASLFIVPDAEEEVATGRAGSDMTVVGVETLDDALEALVEHTGGGDVANQVASGRPAGSD